MEITDIQAIYKTWFFWKNRYYFLKSSDLGRKSNSISFCRDQGNSQFCEIANKDKSSLVNIINNNTLEILRNYILSIKSGDKLTAMRMIVKGLKQFKLALKSDPAYSAIADKLIWDEVDNDKD